MIYFDNAATTHFKPECVISAVVNNLKYFSANSGRGGHRLAVTCAKVIADVREKLCEFVNFDNPDRVVFTKNCTESLNVGILGLLKDGDHAITSIHSHNSVLRPLVHLENQGKISLSIITPENQISLKKQIEYLVTDKTKLVCLTHVSNVTGELLEINEIGAFLKEKNIFFMLDCAQSVGYLPIDFKNLNCDMIAIPCHKGLHSIQGLGALFVGENVELSPIIFGGTGTKSFDVAQPIGFPEGFESGTLNTPAIFGLGMALEWHKKNKASFEKRIGILQKLMNSELKLINNVKVYSPLNQSGISCFEIPGVDSSAVCDSLDSKFEIAVRGGLHCAPLMHKYLKTDKNGLIRASVGIDNTIEDVEYLINSVRKISQQLS